MGAGRRRSLRPWSGTSPASLIIRGLLSLVICVVLAYTFTRMLMPDSGIAGMGADELSFLNTVLVPAIVVAVLSALHAVLRMVVGALDLVPRLTVHGMVVSFRRPVPITVSPLVGYVAGANRR